MAAELMAHISYTLFHATGKFVLLVGEVSPRAGAMPGCCLGEQLGCLPRLSSMRGDKIPQQVLQQVRESQECGAGAWASG